MRRCGLTWWTCPVLSFPASMAIVDEIGEAQWARRCPVEHARHNCRDGEKERCICPVCWRPPFGQCQVGQNCFSNFAGALVVVDCLVASQGLAGNSEGPPTHMHIRLCHDLAMSRFARGSSIISSETGDVRSFGLQHRGCTE